MILTRSPHYINIPIAFPATTTSVTMSLRVWSGLQASVPVEANYTRTKNVPTITTASLSMSLSNMVSDFIEQEPTSKATTGLITANENHSVWVEYTVVYNDTVETISDLTGTLLASDGYGKYTEGANSDIPANKMLLDGDDFQMSRDGVFMIPFLNDGTYASIVLTTDLGVQTLFSPVASTDSDSIINYLYIKGEDFTGEYIDVSFALNTIRIYIIDEYKYESNDVCFINKYGFQQVTPFFKEKAETMRVDFDKFKNNYVSNGVYNTERHQKKQYNKTGNKTFSLSSGHYEEENNEHFEQLLLSEMVYLLKDEVFTPINITGKTIKLKTQLNDKLIGYTINFEYAFDYMNNV